MRSCPTRWRDRASPGNGFLGSALNEAVDNVMFNDADPAEVIADAVARSRREVERMRG